jgi:hypothetical protein
MTSSLVISNFQTGYETDREPFNINNDAFPVLNNAYVWRGRIKKKRGTSLLGRLQRDLTSESLGNTNGSGVLSVNIISFLTLQSDSSVKPGSITVIIGGQTFTDNGLGVLSNGGLGTGTVNYATGALVINTNPVLMTTGATISFSYYANLPVMGLEGFDDGQINLPVLVAFDTDYSYQFNQTTNQFYDVTFYKATGIPFVWSGLDYQQFWSTNYQGALWVTNNVPGFNFLTIATITVNTDGGTTTTITTSAANPLVTGDVVFFNEVTGADANIINLMTFTVTVTNSTTFTIPLVSTGKTLNNSGIFELLTNSSSATGNGIKFYDGDPNVSTDFGWVNFAPPLSNAPTPQYLIGAKIVIPFKNRLLFFGVRLATSGSPGGVYYPNRMVYSENGTPYYASLVPVDQTFEPMAWFQNVAGFGGFLGAPITQEIITVQENEDVLLTGYETKQFKLIFTGDDTFPFFYQTINSELGSQNTFSGVNLDTGAITIGEYGIALTTQVSARRIDLVIPDQVYDISGLNNADLRVTAIRDYRNQFIYFSFSPNSNGVNIFNSQTLLYNYQDNNWAIFEENYTHYGTYQRTSNLTWGTLNQRYPTWAAWTDPWNFGSTAAKYPNIIGGNQQGFVMIKDTGTHEATSQYIESINTSTFIVTSPNHCLNDSDYIEIFGAIGVSNLNSQLFQIRIVDKDNFTLLLSAQQMATPPSGSYLGGGIYRRLTNIFIQSKQFPIFWDKARKTRIGTQRFLLDNAPGGEITVNIYTSQNDDSPSNDPLFGYLIYSNIVLTRPEPEKPYQITQKQIWHRMSNSFIGDTVQIGFTLSDVQMRDNVINSAEITIQSIAFDLYPGPILV